MTRWTKLTLAIFLLVPIDGSGADVYIDDEVGEIVIEGEIAQGDYQKVIDAITQSGEIPERIAVNSAGGRVTEALRIGRFARRSLLKFVPMSRCFSACMLIYFGTVEDGAREDDGLTDDLHDPVFPAFGLHRPYFDRSLFNELSVVEARDRYDALEERVTNYLNDMNVPQDLIDEMFATSSSSMSTLSHEQIIRQSRDRKTHGYQEWIIANCGSLDPLEESHFERLDSRYESLDLSDLTGQSAEVVRKKRDIEECEDQLQQDVRENVLKSIQTG